MCSFSDYSAGSGVETCTRYDYASIGVESEGETETLEVEASEAMEQYVYYDHDGHQIGEIDVVVE